MFYQLHYSIDNVINTHDVIIIFFFVTFIHRQNRKLRDSSNESDDELDAGTSSPPPQPRSTIDDTKNVLPSRIKAVAVRIIPNIIIFYLVNSCLSMK